jgi:hypothetical protein
MDYHWSITGRSSVTKVSAHAIISINWVQIQTTLLIECWAAYVGALARHPLLSEVKP